MATTTRNIKPFIFFTNNKGVDQYSGVMLIDPTSADKLENMHSSSIGQWSSYNQGFSHLTTQLESGATVDSMGWFTTDSGVDHTLAVVNGKVYPFDPATGALSATISSSFVAGERVDFETFKGTVYACSKSLTTQKWSGSGSMAGTSLFPLTVGSNVFDKPTIVEKFNNRLCYANFNGTTVFPSHIAVTDDTTSEGMTLTGTNDANGLVAQVAPGDGQSITAIKSLLLPISNTTILVIFKDRSIYALGGNTFNTFQVYTLNNNYGCLNNRCVVQVGQNLMFMDLNNIYNLTTLEQNGTVQPKVIGSIQVQNTLATLNLSAKDAAWVQHFPQRREVWFAIPTGSNTVADTIIVYHYDQNSEGDIQNTWSTKTIGFGTGESYGACPLLYKTTFLTGDTAGFINTWFNTSTYNGVSVNWTYRYPYYNFGSQLTNKQLRECYAWFLASAEASLTFTAEWRGGGNNTKKSIPITLNSGGTTSLWGSSFYDIGTYSDGLVLRAVKIPVIGNGQQLRITLQGSVGVVFLGLSGLVEYGKVNRNYKS